MFLYYSFQDLVFFYILNFLICMLTSSISNWATPCFYIRSGFFNTPLINPCISFFWHFYTIFILFLHILYKQMAFTDKVYHIMLYRVHFMGMCTWYNIMRYILSVTGRWFSPGMPVSSTNKTDVTILSKYCWKWH